MGLTIANNNFFFRRNPPGVAVKGKPWSFSGQKCDCGGGPCGIGLITVKRYFFFHTNPAGVVVSGLGH